MKEEEVKEMSYQEWKEQQEIGKEQMKYKLEHCERKAGEGENKSLWKNTKVFKRKDDDDPLYTERRVKFFFYILFNFIIISLRLYLLGVRMPPGNCGKPSILI